MHEQLANLADAIEELTTCIRAMTTTPQPSAGACAATRIVDLNAGAASENPCIYLHGHNGVHRDWHGRTWTDLPLLLEPAAA